MVLINYLMCQCHAEDVRGKAGLYRRDFFMVRLSMHSCQLIFNKGQTLLPADSVGKACGDKPVGEIINKS